MNGKNASTVGMAVLLLYGCAGCQSSLPRMWPASLARGTTAAEPAEQPAVVQLLAPLSTPQGPQVDPAAIDGSSVAHRKTASTTPPGAIVRVLPPVGPTTGHARQASSSSSVPTTPFAETGASAAESEEAAIDIAFQRLRAARAEMQARDPVMAHQADAKVEESSTR